MKRKEQMTKEEVNRLLQRFMDGETTLEEEARLGKFFREHKVSGEWKVYQEMFGMFDAGKVEVEEKRPTYWWRVVAVIAVLIGLGWGLMMQFGKGEGEIAQSDTVRVIRSQGAGSKEQEPLRMEKKDESEDSVRKIKEIEKMRRPEKRWMARKEQERKVEKQEEAGRETPLSQPQEIEEREVREIKEERLSTPIEMDYETMKREIQIRGGRLMEGLEMAMNAEEF